ncbi:hypothetical protein N9Z72_02395 [Akkermansiaceae bacterium]|nr:hypothetical protein [Akkermansiaceae bacterium]
MSHQGSFEEIRRQNKLRQEEYTAQIAEYLGVKGDTDLEPYIRTRKPTISDAEGDAEDTTTANGYIRWDALCQLFNAHFIPKNEKDLKPAFTMTCCQLLNEDLPIDTSNPRAGKHISPVLMAKVFNPLEDKIASGQAGALDNSLDPTVCLFPGQDSEALSNSRSQRLSINFSSNGILPPTGDPKLGEEVEAMLNYDLTEHEKKYYIGHIYFNIQRLSQTYQSMKYDEDGVIKEDFYMYDYVKKIWDNANDACGDNHDFKITTDFERPNLVRVVDMRFQENANLKPEDIIELNIQSNTSIVRDFAYNTSIPSAMSSTIAIAAQAPKNADSLEAASFGAFHKNISNRFASFVTPKTPTKPSEEEIRSLSDSFDEKMNTYQQGLKDLGIHMNEIEAGNYLIIGDGGDAVRSEEIGKYKGLVSAVKRASEELNQMYPQDSGNKYKGEIIPSVATKPTSAIIPLKFTATLDGMGGIVIGNVFKIPASRLPRGYKDANIAFVVMGEDQTITSGQDWTVKITGQMIMLPVKPKGGIQNADGWNNVAGGYNQYDEKADPTNQLVENQTGFFNEVSEEQKAIDENLESVKPGNKIYLKLNGDPTFARISPDIDNESKAGNGDNIIGAFPSGNKGLFLGTVMETDTTPIYVMVKGKLDDKNTKDVDEATSDQYYRANADGTPDKSQPVPLNSNGEPDIPNDKWPWYRIKFSEEAQKAFKPGWVKRAWTGGIDENGADNMNTTPWVVNKVGKQGWMRIDVLQTTP